MSRQEKKFRALVRAIAPPVVRRSAAMLLKRDVRFVGRYDRWTDARAQATGYDDALILGRVRQATRALVEGEVAFERDGYAVPDELAVVPWEVLAALQMGHSCDRPGPLRVLDYGGALGTTYYQLEQFFPTLGAVEWTVAEQAHFASAGSQEFARENLHFVDSGAAAFLEDLGDIHVIIFSSVLPYLESPESALIDLLSSTQARVVVVDRTFFSRDATRPSELTLQRTPQRLGGATYPAWVFNKVELRTWIEKESYLCLAEFPSRHDELPQVDVRGMIFIRQ